MVRERLAQALCALLLLCSACGHLFELNMSGSYVVTAQRLYVRSAPTPTSVVLRTYNQGDTLVARPSDEHWMLVAIDGSADGYVPRSSVKGVEEHSGRLFAALDGLADWRRWPFWAALTLMVGLWLLLERLSVRWCERITAGEEVLVRRVPLTPAVLFVCGLLCGLLYRAQHEQMVIGLQGLLSLSPDQLDAMGWTLWVQVLVAIVALLIDLLGSIFKSGVRWGMSITLLDLLLAMAMFATALLLGMGLYLVGAALAVALFGLRYIRLVVRSCRQQPRYIAQQEQE